MFDSLVRGEGVCRTEGENKWGSWKIDKTPSIGAAVYSKLVETEADFRLGTENDVQLSEEVQLRDAGVERLLNKYSDRELLMLFDTLERLRRVIRLEQENLEKDIKNKNINMVSAITKSGMTLYTDAEAMAVGVEVYALNGEEKIKVDADEYEMEDGSVVVVDEMSMISELKESDLTPDELPEEPTEQEDDAPEQGPSDMEAIKGMLENISMKLDALIGEKMSAVEQSIVELNEKVTKIDEIEVKVEKLSVQEEMKSVETIDDVKKVAQNAVENKKRHLDYNMITRLNKKF
jgi:hypothetical protein